MSKIKKYIFYILYAIGFLGGGLIGFFSNSFFAYDKFNSLWANILYILCISLLFITAFVHEVFLSRAVSDIIINSVVFIGGLILILLFFFLGGVFVFITIFCSAIMLTVIGCRYALVLRSDHTAKPDMKRIIAVCALFLFSMFTLMSVEFVDNLLWVWGLIPAFVIFLIACAVTYLLLKPVWCKIYPTKGKLIGNTVCIVLCWFLFSYIFSSFTLGIANCVFDGDPQKVEYYVTDKRIQSGARSVTTHKVKIVIDDKEVWIPVPTEDYFEIEENDLIIIDYYSGALNFAYYSYYGKA